MSDVSDLTGYKGGEDATGKGGRARERKVMGDVEDAEKGKQSSSASPPPTGKQHPAAYRPTPQEKASRNYGAPIDKPILGDGS